MNSKRQTDRDIAMAVLQSLPRNVDGDTILLALHQQFIDYRNNGINDNEYDAEETAYETAEEGVINRWFGCLLYIALIAGIFISMPFLFSIGERFAKRPVKTTASGRVERIEFLDGSTDDTLSGRVGRVTSSHLLIDADDGTTIAIPNEAYRKLSINPNAD